MKTQDYSFGNIKISVYTFDILDSNMYIISDGQSTIVVDPHEEYPIPSELVDRKLSVILTHEHYDHVSGVNWIRENFDCAVITGKSCATEISRTKNDTHLFPLLFIGDKEKFHQIRANTNLPYITHADEDFTGEYRMQLSDMSIILFDTPGHTHCSISMLINDKYLFAGDTLLGDGEELKSLRSDQNEYKCSLEKIVHMCKSDTLVFPGHGKLTPLKNMIQAVNDSYGFEIKINQR